MNQQHNLREISQVELALRKIQGLQLPGPALERFLQGTGEYQYTPSDLVELIESDPAFTVTLLKLSPESTTQPDERDDIIRGLVEKLGLRKIRNVFLSEQIYPAQQRDGGVLRGQMSLFAVACGCCARRISEQVDEFEISSAKAYLTGLLSTVGNLALEQVVPKSFERLVENAKAQHRELTDLQRENLGMDFAQAGKRLLTGIGVSDDIVTGVWLQRSSVLGKVSDVPEAELARLIVLAQHTASKTGIADFEIYSPHQLGTVVARSVGLDEDTLDEIAEECVEEINKRADRAGIYKLQQAGPDWRVFYDEVKRLSVSDSKLSEENTELRKSSSSLEFIRELISDSGCIDSVFDAAGKIACTWKKFYQTGKVCVYALPDTSNIPVVLIETGNKKIEQLANVENREDVIPREGVIPEHLLEQLDSEFDREFCRVIPLGRDGKIFGAVLFELRYPGNWDKIKKEFGTGAFAAGRVLEAAMKVQSRQNLIEYILQAEKPDISTEPQTKKEPAPQPAEESAQQPPEEPASANIPPDQLNLGLEELAAGAAHELNNPLSVISGRAQLLLNDEQDSQRRQILEKISDSASQLSQIVGGLMSYAQPQQPRKSATSIKQIVNEAGQFAEQKTDMEGIDLQVDIKDELPDVNVDSGQIVSAVASVIVNAVESYGSQKGPVQITVQNNESFVSIEIRDFGCGMDEKTLERACYPFFSAKPAGRQRGMGLAYTKRFVELNGGTLSIKSEPDQGTTVNIELPSEHK